jgi:Probable lipoprotein LpqN
MSYVKENNIQETRVNRGDPGSPTIDLPIPDGWEPAGENAPEWAYGAITYTGPEGAEYSPSIVALLSKLTGNVDFTYCSEMPMESKTSPTSSAPQQM